MKNMTNYTDTELETMLVDLESDLVERKESFQGEAPTKIREAVCAFSNDLPDHRRAGVVFVGARDNGQPAGLNVTDELLRSLADIKTDGNIVPPPTLSVAKRRLLNADIAVITVAPADSPPVRYRGRSWIRIGPRRGIASAQDERILNEKRRYRDLPFDAQPVPSARLEDLNTRSFEDEYLPSAFASDVLGANDRSLEQRLAATKMVATADDPTPTVLGLLVLGIRPRDDDRIEIVSPGGPYGAVTPETFGLPGVVDDRNPNLAEALRVLGFVQRFGFGIPTARRELEKNKNPEPVFGVGPNRVVVSVGVRR
jgi:ATP-dependent DNA helicase RecG